MKDVLGVTNRFTEESKITELNASKGEEIDSDDAGGHDQEVDLTPGSGAYDEQIQEETVLPKVDHETKQKSCDTIIVLEESQSLKLPSNSICSDSGDIEIPSLNLVIEVNKEQNVNFSFGN